MDDPADQPDDDPHASDDALQLRPLTTARKTRPKALWAALAAVIVGAGALAVTALGDDGSAAQPLPVALAGTAARASAEGAADSSLAAWGIYAAGPDLPALGGTATAYRLPAATEAQVRHLADVLGVGGTPHHDAETWTVQDGRQVLSVTDSGSWWFDANAGTDGTVSSGDVAVSSGSGSSSSGASGSGGAVAPDCTAGVDCQPLVTTTTVDPCAAPNVDCASPPPDDTVAPPVTGEPLPPDAAPCAKVVSRECGNAPLDDLPSKAEAEKIAVDLLAQTGIDTEHADVQVEGGVQEPWIVSVEPTLGGVPSGLVARVLVGSGGVVTSAGGFLGTPEPVGDYPLLTTQEVIDRTNGSQPIPMGRPAVGPAGSDVATDDAGTAPTTSAATPACKPQPDGREICELVDPAPRTDPGSNAGTTPGVAPPPTTPPEPPTTVEPPKIVLVDATRALSLLPANDGRSVLYLVPAYRFTVEGGGQVDLVAVSDESIAGTPSTETTVPDAGGTDGVVPPTAGCETQVEGDASGTTHTVPTCSPDAPPAPADPVTPQATATAVEER